MAKGKGAHVDVEVGKRVKALRLRANLSQEAVAHHLGLTFQQVQKYEKGANRIGPARLTALAKLFKVPVATFFGEDGNGTAVVVDTRLDTRSRQNIVDLLVKLDSPRIETALFNFLNELVRR